MDKYSLEQKLRKAKMLLEDFTATTASIAPYPVTTVDTVSITKKKQKHEKESESDNKLIQ